MPQGHGDVVSQSGTGTISGNSLHITSVGIKTDPSPKVIVFRARQGTVGGSMTIRPTGISSVIAAPGQLGNNTPAPPIHIVSGRSISPTNAVADTATTTMGAAVSVPVLANDIGTAPTISSVSTPGNGTANISGGNVIYTPATVTVTVPCPWKPVTLTNGSFETPPVAVADWNIPDASTNPSVGWHTTATDNKLEFWRGGASGVPSADGRQFAELNANQASTLYQDLPTVPGTPMTWRLYHRGRLGTDVMRVLIGAPGATVAQTPTGASSPDISDDNIAWGYYTGVYVVPAGQTTTRFAFASVSAAGGSPAFGNFLDGVEFSTPPCPSAAGARLQAGGSQGTRTAH
ncbi:Ig-like domain-containing protein [Nonomuraea aurantiaca]|uniref:Ig-like domain-containing protein n=1 Tax=Nonomuraea aurantiaca TaxID=2878562 RepID=UPI001CD93277|nr:hypothetical protein [Nonomuraea aurantiaca]MCA2221073.1 hypothetical protein [Nonomuraea aurantiaca]